MSKKHFQEENCNSMTKLLPTGSIKRAKKLPTIREFDLIVQGISDTDKIRHLFIIDIEFDYKNATKKQLFFNEIYIPIFEKKKVLPGNEKTVFHLLNAMRLNDKDIINSNKTPTKNHSTRDANIAIPLYAEHLHLLISKCGWRKNKRSLYLKQSKFKKELVIMNQVSRQNCKTDVKKDFNKLMSNANFGYYCRNNTDNCYFQAVFDEIEELSYAKRYKNVFDQDISKFVSTEILDREIEEEFLRKLYALDNQVNITKLKKNSLEIQKKEELDAVFSLKKSKTKKA